MCSNQLRVRTVRLDYRRFSLPNSLFTYLCHTCPPTSIVIVAFAKMLLLVAAKDEANKQEVQRALTDERDAARFTRDAMQVRGCVH